MQELLDQAGPQLSSELEDIAGALFRKAGEMSTAGRENFLTQCADAALSQMVLSCPEVATAKAFIAMYAPLVMLWQHSDTLMNATIQSASGAYVPAKRAP